MTRRYEQHCPIARATEMVCEPWTPLVLRELIRGSQHKDEIAKGLPKMSAALLGTRLRTLTNLGIVTNSPDSDGQTRYKLTPAGQELAPIIDQLGRWSQRWFPEPRPGDLDAELLMLDISRAIDHRRLPAHPFTVEVDIADTPSPQQWWWTLAPDGLAVHHADPHTPASVQLSCTLGSLTRVWLGNITWLQALRDRTVVLSGDPAAVRAMIECVGAGPYATVPRATEEQT